MSKETPDYDIDDANFYKDYVFEYCPQYAVKFGGIINGQLLKDGETPEFEYKEQFLKEKFEFNRRILEDPNNPLVIRAGDPDKSFRLILRKNVINLVKIINNDPSGIVLKEILANFDTIRLNNYEYTQSFNVEKGHAEGTEPICSCKWCRRPDICCEKSGKVSDFSNKTDKYDLLKKRKFNLKLVDGLIYVVKCQDSVIETRINMNDKKWNYDNNYSEESDILKSTRFLKLLKSLQYLRNHLVNEMISLEQFDTRLQNLRETYREELAEAYKEIKL